MRRYAELLGGAEFNCCSIPFAWWTAGRGELSCGVVFSGGPWLLDPSLRVESVFVETQEEQLSGIRWNVVACRVALIVCNAERSSEVLRRSDVDDDGASRHSIATRAIHAESSEGILWQRG